MVDTDTAVVLVADAGGVLAVGIVAAAVSIAVIVTVTVLDFRSALPPPTPWHQAMMPLRAMLSRSPDSA